jgi:hypothetical protein
MFGVNPEERRSHGPEDLIFQQPLSFIVIAVRTSYYRRHYLL